MSPRNYREVLHSILDLIINPSPENKYDAVKQHVISAYDERDEAPPSIIVRTRSEMKNRRHISIVCVPLQRISAETLLYVHCFLNNYQNLFAPYSQ